MRTEQAESDLATAGEQLAEAAAMVKTQKEEIEALRQEQAQAKVISCQQKVYQKLMLTTFRTCTTSHKLI